MSVDFLQGTKPYYQLDISTQDAVRSDFDFCGLTASLNNSAIGIWMFYHEDLSQIFCTEWLSYMHDKGLPVGTCLLFYRSPWYQHQEIHVDIANATGEPSHYAINWTLNDNDDSEMIWYSYPNDAESSKARTPADTPYLGWPTSEFTGKEICRHVLGTQATLVNTSMPHNVYNRGHERWCVSVRFQRRAFDNAGDSWIKAVDFFRPYFKNDTL